MRFRTGLVAGLAVGYYFGARAGRDRYEQIEQYLGQVRSSPAVQQLVARLGELAESGCVRNRIDFDDLSYRRTPQPVPGTYDYQADPTLN